MPGETSEKQATSPCDLTAVRRKTWRCDCALCLCTCFCFRRTDWSGSLDRDEGDFLRETVTQIEVGGLNLSTQSIAETWRFSILWVLHLLHPSQPKNRPNEDNVCVLLMSERSIAHYRLVKLLFINRWSCSWQAVWISAFWGVLPSTQLSFCHQRKVNTFIYVWLGSWIPKNPTWENKQRKQHILSAEEGMTLI